MVPGYPKIFAVGNDYIPDLFKGNIEITEKVDGSMFGFGIDADGEIVIRSKGQQLFVPHNMPKMFVDGINYVLSISDFLKSNFSANTFFYAEYLQSPHHNTLSYERTPKNNLILFGAHLPSGWVTDHAQLSFIANKLNIEVVPLLFSGEFEGDFESIKKLIEETKSVLGKETIEGVVIKNYNQCAMVGSLVFPSFGKYVRESFKERNSGEFKGKTDGGKLEKFVASFKTEARWIKAIQHLKESNELQNDPKDIGRLLKEINLDIIAEEKENIKNELYELFIDRIKRTAVSGFPEFYKEHLLKRGLDNAGKINS